MPREAASCAPPEGLGRTADELDVAAREAASCALD